MSTCFAGDTADDLSAPAPKLYRDRQKNQQLTTMLVAGFTLPHTTPCLEKKCTAYKWLQQKIPAEKPSPYPSGGINPSAHFCQALLGGVSRTFFRENLADVAVCIFADGSFLLGTDIYRLVLSETPPLPITSTETFSSSTTSTPSTSPSSK